MSKMIWDQTGERTYETGVEQCALFPQDNSGAYPLGCAWNGITNVTESPSGAEPTKLYANDKVYGTMMSAEELGGSIEAYTYPDEFAECDGSATVVPGVRLNQQTRRAFGLAYKTLIGNDVVGTAFGYKLHIIWGALASPSEKAHATVNDSPEAQAMSWEFTTTPVSVKGYEPAASMEFDSTVTDKEKLAALEAIIYGSDDVEPRLPMPDEIIALMKGTDASGDEASG